MDMQPLRSAYYLAIEKIMDSLLSNTRVRNQLVVPPSDTLLIPGLVPDPIDQVSFFDSTMGFNEEDLLNPDPTGRVSSDQKRSDYPKPKPTQLLKCTKPLVLSTFNVRTLNGPSQLNELVLSMSNYSIDIIALQEHLASHPNDTLPYSSKSYFQLVTSSATKNSENASVGGVGFLLSPKASSNLTNIESINSRIMIAEFSSNPTLTVVCVYSPHNSAPEEEVEEFYSSLRNLLNDIPQHNFLSVAGDFNAKLECPDVLFSLINLVIVMVNTL